MASSVARKFRMAVFPFSGFIGYAAIIRGAVFIGGKASLVAAAWLAWNAVTALDRAANYTPPQVDLSVPEDSFRVKPKSDFSNYSVIVSRNIFGQAKEEKPPEKPIAPLVKDKFRLVGTNLTPGTDSYAIVENAANNRQDVFAINDVIFDQAVLVEIQGEQIKFEREGTIETLLLEGGTNGAGDGDDDNYGTDFTIAAQDLNRELGFLPNVMAQVRAVKVYRENTQVGMRIEDITKGSLYEKLGMRKGDIIKAINDSILRDPAELIGVFTDLQDTGKILVKAERKGKDLELNYSVQ